MNRSQPTDLPARYVDGELPPEQAAEFEHALAADEMLRSQIERWRQVRAAAQRGFESPAGASALRGRVLKQLAEQRRKSRRPYFIGVLTLTAVAAAWLLLTPIRQTLWNSPSHTAADRLPVVQISISTFANAYRKCSQDPVDGRQYAGRPAAELRKTLTQEAGFPVLVAELPGYSIAGICRCFGDRQVHVVAVHYAAKSAQPAHVTLFSLDHPFKTDPPGQAVPFAHHQQHPMELASADSVSLLTWNERGGHYALCGEANSQTLERLAESVNVADVRVEFSSLALAFSFPPIPIVAR